MRTLTLREHESAPVLEVAGERALSVQEAEALFRAQVSLGVEALRWTSRKEIKAGQYVGMLVSNSVRLEILPKINDLGSGPTRGVLMRMLAAALDLPVYDGRITGHDYQYEDLLDLLIAVYASRVQMLVRLGLCRSYQARSGDLRALRGKFDVTRQFTQLVARPNKIACHYEEFTGDTPLNRLLRCAVSSLRRLAQSSLTQRLLNELDLHLSEIQVVEPSTALLTPITFDRGNNQWKPLCEIARMLLGGIYQTTHAGPASGFALLFDMNELFEKYVAAIAKRVITPLGYSVKAQGPRSSLARTETNQSVFHTIPDLHMQNSHDVIVLDTKWKHIDRCERDFSVSQADAYQMYAYSQRYGARSTILLFPHDGGANPDGPQATWTFEVGGASLIVATLDLRRVSAAEETLRNLLQEQS